MFPVRHYQHVRSNPPAFGRLSRLGTQRGNLVGNRLSIRAQALNVGNGLFLPLLPSRGMESRIPDYRGNDKERDGGNRDDKNA